MNENSDVNHGRNILIKAMLILPVVWIVLTVFNDCFLLGLDNFRHHITYYFLLSR